MFKSPEDFWSASSGSRTPVTDDAIAYAEAVLGVRLPQEYLWLLCARNGGETRGFRIPTPVPTSWAPDHVPLNDLSGIIVKPRGLVLRNILNSAYLREEWGLPPKQVLLSGGGHWWISLDYRRGPSPVVSWIDVDMNEDVVIAPSFGAMLGMLKPRSGS